jgi:hypothetical protein
MSDGPAKNPPAAVRKLQEDRTEPEATLGRSRKRVASTRQLESLATPQRKRRGSSPSVLSDIPAVTPNSLQKRLAGSGYLNSNRTVSIETSTNRSSTNESISIETSTNRSTTESIISDTGTKTAANGSTTESGMSATSPTEQSATEPSQEKKPRQRPRQKMVLDSIRDNSNNRNIIVPYDDFIAFFMENFCCVKCLTNQKLTFTRLTQGLATSITSQCSCGKKAVIKARIRTTADKYEAYQATKVPKLRKSGNYDINVRLMLALHRHKGKDGKMQLVLLVC